MKNDKSIKNKITGRFARQGLLLALAVALCVNISGCGNSETGNEIVITENSTAAVITKNTTLEKPVVQIGIEVDPASLDASLIKPKSKYYYDTTAYEDAAVYPCFSQLDNAAKQAYAEITENVEAGTSTFETKVDYTADEFTEAVNAVYLDQPQLFWLTNGASYYSNSQTGMVTKVLLGFNELADDLKANKKAFNKAVKKALKGLDGLSDTEKERAIHDYLVDHITYEDGSLDQTIYGALVNGSCVCHGYAQAFRYLMNRAGITTYYVSGTGYSDEKWGRHAWNIVKLGKKYYNVDVTWDDNDGAITTYYYYNVTDKTLNTDHKADDMFSFLPACKGTEYSFDKIYGMSADEEWVRTYSEQQLGLTDTELITSTARYSEKMANAIASTGLGSYDISYLIYGDAVEQEIVNMSSESIENNYMNAAINALGLSSWTWKLHYTHTDFHNGYYHLKTTVTLTGG